jgi:hypothetical protein
MEEKLLYEDFITNLEKIYGSFSEKQKRFKKASNSKIARELCYSDSQFSRLINNSASDGEYERAIRNTKRALNEIQLEYEVGKKENPETTFFADRTLSKKKVALYSLCFIAAILLFFILFPPSLLTKSEPSESVSVEKDAMLRFYFENSSVSPYLSLNDLPADCSYPCYKYQGQWSLKDTYKIPVFRERNGFHYLAKDVNLYTRCLTHEKKDGKTFEGYEYQNHEIWYDKRELKFESFIRTDDPTLKTDEYKNLNFEDSEDFVKIALVHTFFRNEFIIDSTSIQRSGMVIGRDVELLGDNILLESLGTVEKVSNIKKEINSIIVNRLEDFSRPVSCNSSQVPDTDFNNIAELDTMSFNCQLTTANAPIQYTKTYILNDQYIETSCRPTP